MRDISRFRTQFAIAVLFVAFAVGQARAQDARGRMLVSVDQLATMLKDPKLVVLHVGQPADYSQAHIPGARLVTLQEVSAPYPATPASGLMLELPPVSELRRKLESLGVSDDSRIVVYYANESVTAATRVLYTLDWMGLGDRASLLDGGLRAWTSATQPVTAEEPLPRPGRLTERPVRSDALVAADWVKSHLNRDGFTIIDARAPVYYSGEQSSRGTRPGHIPGARNVAFTSVTDDALRIRPNSELAKLFAEAGVKPTDTIVAYCHIGQQATAIVYAARLLGYNVVLYDGSFTEWGAKPEFPVETGR